MTPRAAPGQTPASPGGQEHAPAERTSLLYHDGEFLPASQVRLAPTTQGLNYGTGVFEGIRAYWHPGREKLYLLKAREHYERLIASCRLLRLDVPASPEELVEITTELLRRNGHRADTYVRPLAFKRAFEPGAAFGVRLRGVTTSLSIHTVPMASPPFGEGLRCCVSSWRRIPDSSLPARAKITGGYANNALAVDEAQAAGFDEPILLNQAGALAEASTANIFLARHDALLTPPPSADILEGITRGCVMELARNELGVRTMERDLARSELYAADEILLSGTGIEIQPVREVDGRTVGTGKPGPITERLRLIYRAATRGEVKRYQHWLTPIAL